MRPVATLGQLHVLRWFGNLTWVAQSKRFKGAHLTSSTPPFPSRAEEEGCPLGWSLSSHLPPVSQQHSRPGTISPLINKSGSSSRFPPPKRSTAGPAARSSSGLHERLDVVIYPDRRLAGSCSSDPPKHLRGMKSPDVGDWRLAGDCGIWETGSSTQAASSATHVLAGGCSPVNPVQLLLHSKDKRHQ